MAQQDQDTRTRDNGSAADRRVTITQTSAVTGAVGGGVIVLMWALGCFKAHTLVPPTIEEAAGILMVFGPFLHLLGRIIMYWTGRLLPKDANVAIALIMVASLMASCTTSGGIAGGTGKPVDWAVTVKNTCIGVKSLIAVVDAVYTGDPKIFGNQNNANVYLSVKKTVLDACGTTPPADLQTAETNLLLAASDAGSLITTLRANGVIK